jgi:hypothetical protein
MNEKQLIVVLTFVGVGCRYNFFSRSRREKFVFARHTRDSKRTAAWCDDIIIVALVAPTISLKKQMSYAVTQNREQRIVVIHAHTATSLLLVNRRFLYSTYNRK